MTSVIDFSMVLKLLQSTEQSQGGDLLNLLIDLGKKLNL